MFYLEGKTVNVKEPPAPEPIQVAPAPPKYIGETQDYGLRLLVIDNPALPGGAQASYIVEHKQHGVIGYQSQVLFSACEAMAEIQAGLDKVLNRDKVKS